MDFYWQTQIELITLNSVIRVPYRDNLHRSSVTAHLIHSSKLNCRQIYSIKIKYDEFLKNRKSPLLDRWNRPFGEYRLEFFCCARTKHSRDVRAEGSPAKGDRYVLLPGGTRGPGARQSRPWFSPADCHTPTERSLDAAQGGPLTKAIAARQMRSRRQRNPHNQRIGHESICQIILSTEIEEFKAISYRRLANPGQNLNSHSVAANVKQRLKYARI